jgi:hypothetical protein
MTARNPLLDASTAARLEETVAWLLTQIEAQTRLADALAGQGTPAQLEPVRRQLDEMRDRLVRLRADLLGPGASAPGPGTRPETEPGGTPDPAESARSDLPHREISGRRLNDWPGSD